jgi:hypothetical protein
MAAIFDGFKAGFSTAWISVVLFSVLDALCVLKNTISMLHNIPKFDHYYVAFLKDDPAKEPIAASYSAPGVVAEAAHKTGRAKADFELVQISKAEFHRLKSLNF